jgi:hypothetical protein
VLFFILVILGSPASADGQGDVDTSKSPHAKLRSVAMEDVQWTTGFWANRFALCRTAMLPRLHSTMLDPKCSAQLNRLKFGAGMIPTNPEAVASANRGLSMMVLCIPWKKSCCQRHWRRIGRRGARHENDRHSACKTVLVSEGWFAETMGELPAKAVCISRRPESIGPPMRGSVSTPPLRAHTSSQPAKSSITC